jgi:predicted RNA binding protein with dsRBD fold (UPF0201 family)
MNVIVRVSAPVYPTEIEEKVRESITNLFPVELQIRDFGTPQLYGEGNLETLRLLYRRLREDRILDTARHKQVAFAGKLNFPGGVESLGSIYIEISAENEDSLLRIIDWLAPETIDGKPVGEIEL